METSCRLEHVIVEAKRGWWLPLSSQLDGFAERLATPSLPAATPTATVAELYEIEGALHLLIVRSAEDM